MPVPEGRGTVPVRSSPRVPAIVFPRAEIVCALGDVAVALQLLRRHSADLNARLRMGGRDGDDRRKDADGGCGQGCEEERGVHDGLHYGSSANPTPTRGGW